MRAGLFYQGKSIFLPLNFKIKNFKFVSYANLKYIQGMFTSNTIPVSQSFIPRYVKETVGGKEVVRSMKSTDYWVWLKMKFLSFKVKQF